MSSQIKSDNASFSGRKIRVLIVDDYPLVSQGLAQLLRMEPDIDVVGEAADGLMAVDIARKLQPDVVIMDVHLPRLSGLEATQLITQEFADIRVIGLSFRQDDEPDWMDAMRQAGATVNLDKSFSSEQIIAAIRGCTS